jgi:anthranilate synthase component 1
MTAVTATGAALRTLAANFPARYPVFFDSAASGPLAQFSMLACEPRATLVRDSNGQLSSSHREIVAGGFLDNLEAWYRGEATPEMPDSLNKRLPFLGGWFVYLGYEVAAEIEPRVRMPPADAPYSAFALRVENFAIHDITADRVYAVSQHGDEAAHAQLVRDLETAASSPAAAHGLPPKLATLDEEPEELFLTRVRAAQEYIAAGDIYQANLSRRWNLKLQDRDSAEDIYQALRHANPAPFAACVRWNGWSIFSSSPERLLRISGREISTRPIAGTRPRHGSPEQDRRDTAELVAHPKERAEHIMLIDLERNDLGRVCEAGSVTVDEYMVTESYAHVHHIVSNVRGRLRVDCSPIDALRALFPGGTITGCPKVRCMQIIAALEGSGRGAYTGSLGWLGTDGDADFNILIRTLTMRGDAIELRAGAGIVADSIPAKELEETRAKARGLLRAFGEAP